MLRQPADGFQRRKIDRTYLDFALDARNIRFALSTDGMNLFGEMSSSHNLACDSMYIQSNTMALHDAKIHHDASAYPEPKATW
jgi:hypothetical protein